MYELVEVDKLKPHPANPRRGNVPKIRESIQRNGFFGALVAQRSTGYVLVGNHRLEAAKLEGVRRVPVLWKLVDDEEAKAILLADNRTSDIAGYDEQALADLLESMGSLEGTGFDGLLKKAKEEVEKEEGEEEPPPDKYKEIFAITLVCEDEEDQEALYAELSLTFPDREIKVVSV